MLSHMLRVSVNRDGLGREHMIGCYTSLSSPWKWNMRCHLAGERCCSDSAWLVAMLNCNCLPIGRQGIVWQVPAHQEEFWQGRTQDISCMNA